VSASRHNVVLPLHGPSSRLTGAPISTSRTGFVPAQTLGASPGIVGTHGVQPLYGFDQFERGGQGHLTSQCCGL